MANSRINISLARSDNATILSLTVLGMIIAIFVVGFVFNDFPGDALGDN